MKEFLICVVQLFCLFTYSNIILAILAYMYPKFMFKFKTYVQVFAVTILITIGWIAQFGTMGKYVKWTLDDVEYEIILPRIGEDDSI